MRIGRSESQYDRAVCGRILRRLDLARLQGQPQTRRGDEQPRVRAVPRLDADDIARSGDDAAESEPAERRIIDEVTRGSVRVSEEAHAVIAGQCIEAHLIRPRVERGGAETVLIDIR